MGGEGRVLRQCCCVTNSLGVSGADRNRYFHHNGCGPVDLLPGPGLSGSSLGNLVCPCCTGLHKSHCGAALAAGEMERGERDAC